MNLILKNLEDLEIKKKQLDFFITRIQKLYDIVKQYPDPRVVDTEDNSFNIEWRNKDKCLCLSLHMIDLDVFYFKSLNDIRFIEEGTIRESSEIINHFQWLYNDNQSQ